MEPLKGNSHVARSFGCTNTQQWCFPQKSPTSVKIIHAKWFSSLDLPDWLYGWYGGLHFNTTKLGMFIFSIVDSSTIFWDRSAWSTRTHYFTFPFNSSPRHGSNWPFSSLVPRPLPDFISQPRPWRDQIWEWPGDEASLLAHGVLQQTVGGSSSIMRKYFCLLLSKVETHLHVGFCHTLTNLEEHMHSIVYMHRFVNNYGIVQL